MTTVTATITDQPEVIPANYFEPLDLEAIFGCSAPIEVDLGCGDGSFLAAAAAANPAGNFLGIDRMAGRVRSACRKIELSNLSNARVLRCEVSYAVRELIPAGSVAAFHLMFPDPWPKRRHAPRRIVTKDFLDSLQRGLAAHGTVRIATDEREYYRKIERLAALAPEFVAIQEQEMPVAISTFEKRFRQDGLKIHRLVLRKVSSSRNEVASQ